MIDASPVDQGKGRSGCRTVLLVGCGVAVVAVIAIGSLVAFNWARIKSLYKSASGTLTELETVRSALQAKYDTPQVTVMTKRNSGVSGSILNIGLVNPPFLANLDREQWERKAEEVAIAARDALPADREYDHYEVGFSRQWGIGFSVHATQWFAFESRDLPPRTPAPHTN